MILNHRWEGVGAAGGERGSGKARDRVNAHCGVHPAAGVIGLEDQFQAELRLPGDAA